jgi:hypothetical protein
MESVCGLLQLLAAGLAGVFAGAMLTEGFTAVPYWRSLAPGEFFAWYAANDARLLGYFRPLTIATAVAALASTTTAMLADDPGRWHAVASLALLLAAVAMFFVYFEGANRSFSDATAELPAELERWAKWHAVRTVLSLLALVFALSALHRGS